MTRHVDARLGNDIIQLLGGNDLEACVGLTFVLSTVDGEGWPHVALLSVGEVLATSDTRVRLALWPRSSTAGNLKRTELGLLSVIVPGRCLYVRLKCRQGPDLKLDQRALASFMCEVERVLEDTVGYASLESGVKFTVHDQPAVLARWRATISKLRSFQD